MTTPDQSSTLRAAQPDVLDDAALSDLPITVTGAFSRHTDGMRVEVAVDTRTAWHYLTPEDADALAVELTDAAETARRLSFDGGALLEEDAR